MTLHEHWRSTLVPSPHTELVLSSGGVGMHTDTAVPFLYVNLSRVQGVSGEIKGRGEDGVKAVVDTFVGLTEVSERERGETTTCELLGISQDSQKRDPITNNLLLFASLLAHSQTCLSLQSPLHPRVSQLIDLDSVGLGFNPLILRRVYEVFEANYPETLDKFVLYPVNRFLQVSLNTVMGFVNQRTRDKFVVTDDLGEVCRALGVEEGRVREMGGLREFVADGKVDGGE